MRVRAKSAFKSFYFFVTKKKHKKADTVCIKYYLTRNTNAQQLLQPPHPISKSTHTYSVAQSFPQKISTKGYEQQQSGKETV